MSKNHATRRSSRLRVYWIAAFGIAALSGLFLWTVLSFDPLLSWLVSVNLAAFLAYGYDKSIAGTGQLRVPEKLLLALAYTGGSLGALAGMRLFNHKTAKVGFQVRFWLIVAIQILLVLFYFVVIEPSL